MRFTDLIQEASSSPNSNLLSTPVYFYQAYLPILYAQENSYTPNINFYSTYFNFSYEERNSYR